MSATAGLLLGTRLIKNGQHLADVRTDIVTQTENAWIGDTIIDVVAALGLFDQPGAGENRQMPRDVGLAESKLAAQFLHGFWTFP